MWWYSKQCVVEARVAQREHRGGLTVVEVLVVVGVITLLIALLIPALQAAREEARRSQCGNSLKQIGLGLQHYADANKSFPYDALWGQNPNNAKFGETGHTQQLAYHYPWNVAILPYVTSLPLYNAVNKRQPIWNQSQEFGTGGNPVVKPPQYFGYVQSQQVLSRCPSDRTFPGPGDEEFTGPTVLPDKCMWTNYAGNAGVGFYSAVAKSDVPCEGKTTAPIGTKGFFTFNEPATFGTIKDGTSYTISVTEVTGGSVAAPTATGGNIYNASLNADLVFRADAPQPAAPDWYLPARGDAAWSPPSLALGGTGRRRSKLLATPGGATHVPMVFRSSMVALTEMVTGTGPCSAGMYTAAQGGPCGVARGSGPAGFELGGAVGPSVIVGIAPLYNALYSPNSNWPGPDSFHPGIVMVVFGDGHTSRISNSITFSVWASLNTRQGGESIDGEF